MKFRIERDREKGEKKERKKENEGEKNEREEGSERETRISCIGKLKSIKRYTQRPTQRTPLRLPLPFFRGAFVWNEKRPSPLSPIKHRCNTPFSRHNNANNGSFSCYAVGNRDNDNDLLNWYGDANGTRFASTYRTRISRNHETCSGDISSLNDAYFFQRYQT